MFKLLINALCFIYALLIFGIPGVISYYSLQYLPVSLAIGFFPFIFAISFPITAGILSLPAQKYIRAGKFPRDLNHSIYGRRRLYNFCWTAVYYSGPIYWLFLSLPWLRTALFRLFGYRGSMNITLYPDTWIRDLPLLDIEEGVYLANRSTIGTNMCLISGDIIVNKLTIKKGAMVGHFCAIGPGVVLEENSEVTVGCRIGIGAMIGKRSQVNMNTFVSHFARIGSDVKIGDSCHIGRKAKIADGIKISSGTIIPEKAIIDTQEEADKYNLKRAHVNENSNSGASGAPSYSNMLAD